MSFLFRIPRPRSCLGLISLRTATELITVTLLVNKVTGLYGMLALFTGYQLNFLQLSLYLYSIIVLGLVVWLSPAIRQPNLVLKNIGLAWLYVLDSAINSLYTAFFGAAWFVVLSQHLNDDPSSKTAPGGDTIKDTSGFTDPKHDVTSVDVVAEPGPGALDGQSAVAHGHTDGTLGGAIFQSGSMASLTVLILLWTLRAYFCLIVMSYARSVLRHHIATSSTASGAAAGSTSDDPTLAENPFASATGWKGTLGRIMLRFPTKTYWLGRDEAQEADWVRATSGRFEDGRGARLKVRIPKDGVGERERRARSGTGPPPPVAGKPE